MKRKIKLLEAKKQKTKRKKIDLYDVDHPFRRTAIDIIKGILEPLLRRGINGKQYYALEDSLTIAINKRLKTLIKSPLKLDTTESNGKVLINDRLPDDDNDSFYNDEDEEDDDY